jgi:hypothetical protein
LSRNAWLLVAYLAFVAVVLGGVGVVIVPRVVSTASRVGAAPRISPRPGATVPPEVPSGFPAYPGAVLIDGRGGPGGEAFVTWESRDDPERVYAFYHRQLGSGPWRITQAVDIGPIKQVQFANAGRPLPEGQVVIQPLRDGGSAVVLEMLPNAPGTR